MKPKVILDSNLLLLLVVGETSRDFIAAYKRLRAYTPYEYDLLVDLLRLHSGIILTPNTVTETSNLLEKVKGPS